MTTAAPSRHTRHRSSLTVDIAGTAWPLYKIEALVAALGVFLLVLAIAQVLQTAVLTAAAVAVVVWWTRRAMLAHRRD
ncbi:hypothetical protein AB4Z09_15505 [Rhodococcus sp. TAF43]|uniref:hypothetical protein n=1 Tax=unclassified Rhodococcus (in: high G+C Gram-positive bacteria) TaxID=192944 RepID=UPI000E0B6527|nr:MULTISPECIES: hypothetical protein [unclassified Rhodococcus (in: high G+C Gram-positive bacteria)]QKT12004.1 hypothetical protein HUN07_15945 [Rhodococcus sp. W8901]